MCVCLCRVYLCVYVVCVCLCVKSYVCICGVCVWEGDVFFLLPRDEEGPERKDEPEFVFVLPPGRSSPSIAIAGRRGCS